jgi:hypothetical protein
MRLDEARKPTAQPGAGAFSQMGNTLSGSNKTKSSTGGTTTQTPTGRVHTASPTNPNQPQAPEQPQQQAPAAKGPAPTQLTKKWIQYLKSNQIVSNISDPKTGKLTYRRQVFVDDMVSFLEGTADYTEEEINAAVSSVSAVKKTSGGKVPGQVSQTPGAVKKRAARQAKKQSVPAAPTQPPPTPMAVEAANRPSFLQWLQEAIVDGHKPVLSEKDVEAILAALPKKGGDTEPAEPAASAQAATPADPKENIKKITDVINNKMTDAQRQMLWRALNAR